MLMHRHVENNKKARKSARSRGLSPASNFCAVVVGATYVSYVFYMVPYAGNTSGSDV